VRIAKLLRVQNSAARLICSVCRCESITPVLRSLHWLPVIQRIVFKIASLVFRCLIGMAPLYLSDLIKLRESARDTRSSSQLILLSPRSRTKSFGDRAFSVAAPRIWNSLPVELRLLALHPLTSQFSLSQFRSKLKTFLFNAAYVNWYLHVFILSELVVPLITHMEKALPNTKCNTLLLLLLYLKGGVRFLIGSTRFYDKIQPLGYVRKIYRHPIPLHRYKRSGKCRHNSIPMIWSKGSFSGNICKIKIDRWLREKKISRIFFKDDLPSIYPFYIPVNFS
jgi:hypothetical protein